MPSIYDSYQLSNSRLSRPYVGSTLDELSRTSSILQERYDASSLGIEGLDEFVKQAKALPKDTPLLQARLKEYTDKIKDWSGRKDLENVTQDVYKASRQLANEYQNFSGNYKAAMDYKKHLDDLVQKGPGQGGVSRETADALYAKSMDDYKGLQYDPTTGKYDQIYQGDNVAGEINTNDWIKKVASDVAASSNKRVVEKDGGLYFQTSTGSLEEVNFEKDLKPAIARAYALDTELQSDFKQRAQLAGWKSKNVTLQDIPKDPQYAGLRTTIKGLIDKGVNPSDAIQSAIANGTYKDLYGTLENLGRKYAYHKVDTENTIGGLTFAGEEELARRKKEIDKTKNLLALAYTTPGSGVEIKRAGDVTDLQNSAKEDYKTAFNDWSQWFKGKTRVGNRFLGRDADGNVVDMTDEAQEYLNKMNVAKKDDDRLESIKREVANKVGYKLGSESALDAGAQKAYTNTRDVSTALNSANQQNSAPGFVPAEHLTGAEIEKKAQEARSKYYDEHMKDLPRYKEYEQELVRRLNPAAESSTLVMIQDENTRKAWSDNLTALTKNLGLKDGPLSFTIASGPDQGQPITAGQYDDIKGEVEVIGFDTDKDGQTVMKLRANKDIKGKKTEGEDMLLNLGNTNVDKYLAKEMDPQQFLQFKGVAAIKKALNNKSRSGEMIIPDTDISARIRSENGKWVVSLPGRDGFNEQRADSYEGVLDILLKASDIYNKK